MSVSRGSSIRFVTPDIQSSDGVQRVPIIWNGPEQRWGDYNATRAADAAPLFELDRRGVSVAECTQGGAPHAEPRGVYSRCTARSHSVTALGR
jgi:hypothetical protein